MYSSCWLHGHRIFDIFDLCDQISLRKLKSLRNRFSLFIWGLGQNFWVKNGQKSRDTVPLSRVNKSKKANIPL